MGHNLRLQLGQTVFTGFIATKCILLKNLLQMNATFPKRSLWVCAAPRPHQRSFSAQLLANTESYS